MLHSIAECIIDVHKDTIMFLLTPYGYVYDLGNFLYEERFINNDFSNLYNSP